MQTTKRPLTEVEQTQLALSKARQQQRLQAPFGWTKLLVAIVLEIVFILVIYYFGQRGFSWLAKMGVVVVPFYIWWLFKSHSRGRKDAAYLLDLARQLEAEGVVEVTEYHCSKAIELDYFEGEGPYYALEIGENRLLFWLDYSFAEGESFPVTRFEAYERPEFSRIFGSRIRVQGEKLPAVKIQAAGNWSQFGELPRHRAVIASDIDSFLRQIREKVQLADDIVT